MHRMRIVGSIGACLARRPGVAAAAAVAGLGALLSVVAPGSAAPLPRPYGWLSSYMGWACFVAWSLSFYPQIASNQRRRSVEGLSLDFAALNLLGFVSYAAYTSALMWNDAVIREFQAAHRSSERPVHLNDVVFALHAAAATAVLAAQAALLDRGQQQQQQQQPQQQQRGVGAGLSRPCLAGMAAAAAAVGGYGLALVACRVAGSPGRRGGCAGISVLGLLYVIGAIKIGVTLTKYAPQAMLNAARRSTRGWSVLNVWLDLSGGLLSAGQILLVCSLARDWSRVTGNPVTIGLAAVSIAFDLVFIAQHHCLYGDKQPPHYAPAPQQQHEVQLPAVAAAARCSSPPSQEEEGARLLPGGPAGARGADDDHQCASGGGGSSSGGSSGSICAPPPPPPPPQQQQQGAPGATPAPAGQQRRRQRQEEPADDAAGDTAALLPSGQVKSTGGRCWSPAG